MADEKKAKGDGAKAKGDGAKAKGEGAKPKSEGAKPKGEGKAKAQGKEGGKAARAAKESQAAGATQAERPRAPKEKPRLASFYMETVKPALMEKFKYSSPMQAPRFEKIVINMGVGAAVGQQRLP